MGELHRTFDLKQNFYYFHIDWIGTKWRKLILVYSVHTVIKHSIVDLLIYEYMKNVNFR